MRMADRAVRELQMLQSLKEEGLEANISGPQHLATSSFAFALEVYFKAIAYSQDQRTPGGHDLIELWDDLSEQACSLIERKFDAHSNSTGQDWTVLLQWDQMSPGKELRTEVRTPEGNVRGVLEGHRDAFKLRRYGYEVPKGTVKAHVVNIEGLQLLCWIARELATMLHHSRREEMKASGAKSGTIQFPVNGPVQRFPGEES